MKTVTSFLICLIIVGYGSLQFLTPNALSYANVPPSGRAGDPANGMTTCNTSGCHSGSATQAASGWITSTIPGTGYVPGNTYTITGTATYAGRNTFGFEISPQNAAGTKLGTLVNTSTQTAIVGTGYITQRSSGLSGSGSKSWSFDWIAPSPGSGAVNFYGAFNCANGNGGTSGDLIYTSTLAVQETAPVGTDAGIANIDYPSTQACSMTFSPQVTLMNYGANTLTTTTINYKIDGVSQAPFAWAGSLVSNASTMVALPAVTTTATTHTFDASTSGPNGITDNNIANDAASQTNFSIVTAQSLPFFEGFENAYLPTGFTANNPDASTTWVKSTAASKTGSASAFMDYYNYNARGETDDIITPPVDLSSSNNPELTFELAYSLYTNPTSGTPYSDTLEVLVSTDCGVTWVSVYKKSSTALTTTTATFTTASFVPTANEWRMETVNLAAFSSSSDAMIMFRGISDYENGMYIDDINVKAATVTAIENLSIENELTIFPNPSTGHITISNMDYSTLKTILIYSYTGELVKTYSNTKRNQFDLSELKKGIYFMNIITDKIKETKKLILSK